MTALAVTGASLAGGLTADAPPNAAATGASRSGAPAATAAAKGQYTIPGTPGWSAPPATPPASCKLERLPAPDRAPMALVSGADPAGRYLVGRSYPEAGGYQAVIWHDGTARKVMLPGDLEESLPDVNSTGTAVGWSYAGSGPVPYAYSGGKVAKLARVRVRDQRRRRDRRRRRQVPAGLAVGDREADPAAGARRHRPGRRPRHRRGRHHGRHPGRRAAVRLVPRRDPPRAAAAGARRGAGRERPGLQHPQRLGDRGGHRRHRPHGGKAGPNSSADSSGKMAAPVMSAVRWNVRTGEVRTTAALDIGATAANAHGWQVGTDKQGRAVLVTDTATVVLPDLASHQPGGLATIANTVSDDGRTIGGQSDNAAGVIQAVVWRCR